MKPSRILLPAAWIYGAGVRLRNLLYDQGILRSKKLDIPVISVGNITAGGTGKTPFIEFLIRELDERGKKVAVVSRGYGRNSIGTQLIGAGDPNRGSADLLGDELSQIARKFSCVTVVADSDRARGAEIARSRFGADLILLDDGFQHRAIARDLDIVLVDVTKPLSGDAMLPAGYRREPVSSLHRADIVSYTRVDGARKNEFSQLMKQFPGIQVRFRSSGIRKWNEKNPVSQNALATQSFVAFCGVGNPDSFFETIRSMGIVPKESISSPDHHRYSAADRSHLLKLARENNATLLTTEKDAARLDGDALNSLGPLFVAEIQAEIIEGNDLFQERLNRILA